MKSILIKLLSYRSGQVLIRENNKEIENFHLMQYSNSVVIFQRWPVRGS